MADVDPTSAEATPPQEATPQEATPQELWFERLRNRQSESYRRLAEQQWKAEERFGEISNEIFASIMGPFSEKKEPTP